MLLTIDLLFWGKFLAQGCITAVIATLIVVIALKLPVKGGAVIPAAIFSGFAWMCIVLRIPYLANVVPEFRDGAIIKVVDLFAKGINPFSTSILEATKPEVYLDSGFANIFLPVLLEKIFPISANVACLIGSVMYGIIAQVAFFVLLRQQKFSRSVSLIASVVIITATRRSNCYMVYRPDVFCMICIILIIMLYEKSIDEALDEKKAFVIALLANILFFTKIHYVLVMVPIVILMFVKRQKSFWLLMLNIFVVFIASIAFIMLVFPTFLSTFGVHVIEMFISNSKDSSVSVMIHKWVVLTKEYLPVFAGIATVSFLLIKKKGIKGILANNEKNLFEAIYFIMVLAILCFLGKWSAAGLNYHYVMLIPIATLILVRAYSALAIKVNVNRVVEQVFLVLLIVFSVMMCNLIPDYQGLKENANTYEKLYDTLDKVEGDIFISPVLAVYAIDRGKDIWDCGDLEYLPTSNYGLDKIFPYTSAVYDLNKNYYNTVESKIKNHEYELIILPQYLGKCDYSKDVIKVIEDNYQLNDSVDIELEANPIELLMYK